MATPPILKDRSTLYAEFVRRVLAYTTRLTWWGENSVAGAFGRAAAGLAEHAYQLYVALVRRVTLFGAQDEYLTQVAAEHGTERAAATRAKVLVIVRPNVSGVAGIRVVGADDYIEVDDTTGWAAAATGRIRSEDGATTEAFTVASVSLGTGPVNGDDELVVTGGLALAYSPATEDVDVLVRVTLPTGTGLTSEAGPAFDLLEAVTTSDRNPVLDGEGAAVGLLDKAWAECTAPGASGNIEALTITGLATPVSGVRSVQNPAPATGGADEELDYDLRYRAAHRATAANQETLAWFEAVAKAGDQDLLRTVKVSTTTVGTVALKVLHRNGGSFTAVQLAAMEDYLEDRVRAGLQLALENVTLTSVEVEAEITLDPDTTLEDVYRRAAASLATYLDYRTWEFGADVDESALLALVRNTPGVASLVTASFLPAADVAVDDDSLPTLSRLSLTDTTSGDVLAADLDVAF